MLLEALQAELNLVKPIQTVSTLANECGNYFNQCELSLFG